LPTKQHLGLWLPLYFVLLCILPWAVPSAYLVETITALNLQLVFVLSWDLFCGPTRETNFGHTFFIGGAAYTSALLTVVYGWDPRLSAAVALLVTAGVGAAVGWIAARCRGPSFALLTMGLQLMFFQALFLFPGVFGAEEGIIGIAPWTEPSLADFFIVLTGAASVALIHWALHRSTIGLQLTAVGDDEELARSSGVNARRLKVGAFTLSAILGGFGGVLYAHTQSQVNAELAGSGLAVQIVLLGLVGGVRTGPALAVVLFFLLRRSMAGVVSAEGLVYAAVLVAAAVLFPRGIVVAPTEKGSNR